MAKVPESQTSISMELMFGGYRVYFVGEYNKVGRIAVVRTCSDQ